MGNKGTFISIEDFTMLLIFGFDQTSIWSTWPDKNVTEYSCLQSILGFHSMRLNHMRSDREHDTDYWRI